MNTLEKAQRTALVRHIDRFSKPGIPIYNSEVPDTTGRIARKRRKRKMKNNTGNCNAIILQSGKDFKKNFLSFISNHYYDCIFKWYHFHLYTLVEEEKSKTIEKFQLQPLI